jgi:fused signal recognition particle receptor
VAGRYVRWNFTGSGERIGCLAEIAVWGSALETTEELAGDEVDLPVEPTAPATEAPVEPTPEPAPTEPPAQPTNEPTAEVIEIVTPVPTEAPVLEPTPEPEPEVPAQEEAAG